MTVILYQYFEESLINFEDHFGKMLFEPAKILAELIVCKLLLSSLTAASSPEQKGCFSIYDNVPIKNNVTLFPQVDNNSFNYYGEAEIFLKIETNCSLIYLDTWGFYKIEEVILKNEYNIYTDYLDLTKSNLIEINFPKLIIGGNYTLNFKYYKDMNDRHNYFKFEYYMDNNGDNKWIFWSTLKPLINLYIAHYDPKYDNKGSYNITVKHNANYTTLSTAQSSAVTTKENDIDEVWTFNKNFDTDYVTTMVVGELEYISDSRDELIRVWTRKNTDYSGVYILNFWILALRVVENLTGIPYKSFKLGRFNVIAVPAQTFFQRNERLILLSDKYLAKDGVSVEDKSAVYRMITKLFIELWIEKVENDRNENHYLRYGLNHYLEAYIIDKVEPSGRLLERITFVEPYHLHSNDRFYYNSQFLIKMMVNIVGEDKFKIGLHNYLSSSTYKNNRTDSFMYDFTNLPHGNERTVNALNDWVEKREAGYPIVTVKRNYVSLKATVTQSPFFEKPVIDLDDLLWVPLNFATEDDPNFNDTKVTHWLDPRLNLLQVPSPKGNKWLICNKKQFGFYRVNYDRKNWELITDFLKSNNYRKIHEVNRAQLINDAFALAEIGELRYKVVFNLVEYLKHETDLLPWAAFWGQIISLHKYSALRTSQYYDTFKEYILTLTKDIEKKVILNTAESDDPLKQLHKGAMIYWTCSFGSRFCRNFTLARLTKWLENPDEIPIPKDMKGAILCGGIRSADQNTWDKLMEKFKQSGDKDVGNALTCSSDDQIMNKFISILVNDTLAAGNADNLCPVITNMLENSDLSINALWDALDYNNTNANCNIPLPLKICILLKIPEFVKSSYELEKLKQIERNYFNSGVLKISFSTIASRSLNIATSRFRFLNDFVATMKAHNDYRYRVISV